MFDRQFLAATRRFTDRIARALANHGVKADQVTWTGFGVGMLAVPLIITGHYWLAILAILLNRVADGLDGAIARSTFMTDRGAFLDITLDFMFYSAVPLAFAIADTANNGLAAIVLIYAFVGTGTSFLAYAILAARRGMVSTDYPGKGFHYIGGLTEATETIVIFTAMCLFPAWFSWLAFFFAGLCGLTTATRILAGIRAFKSRPKSPWHSTEYRAYGGSKGHGQGTPERHPDRRLEHVGAANLRTDRAKERQE